MHYGGRACQRAGNFSEARSLAAEVPRSSFVRASPDAEAERSRAVTAEAENRKREVKGVLLLSLSFSPPRSLAGAASPLGGRVQRDDLARQLLERAGGRSARGTCCRRKAGLREKPVPSAGVKNPRGWTRSLAWRRKKKRKKNGAVSRETISRLRPPLRRPVIGNRGGDRSVIFHREPRGWTAKGSRRRHIWPPDPPRLSEIAARDAIRGATSAASLSSGPLARVSQEGRKKKGEKQREKIRNVASRAVPSVATIVATARRSSSSFTKWRPAAILECSRSATWTADKDRRDVLNGPARHRARS